jgi:hypothetical protein
MVKTQRPSSNGAAQDKSFPPFIIIRDHRKSLKLKKQREGRKLKQLQEK